MLRKGAMNITDGDGSCLNGSTSVGSYKLVSSEVSRECVEAGFAGVFVCVATPWCCRDMEDLNRNAAANDR